MPKNRDAVVVAGWLGIGVIAACSFEAPGLGTSASDSAWAASESSGSTTNPDDPSTSQPTTDPTTDPSGASTTTSPTTTTTTTTTTTSEVTTTTSMTTDNTTTDETPGECGNGVIDGDEECDDGNTVDNDGCSNACTLPVCGDGTIQASEQCDDGNTENGDGCSATCQLEQLRVFVTSKSYTGNLGGLAGADEECQVLADNVDLGGTWMAWLSTSESGPNDRFITKGTVPYTRLDRTTIIANDWDELVQGPLLHAIAFDENGINGGQNRVWTNTNNDGTPRDSDKECHDWASEADEGNHGNRTKTDEKWTFESNTKCSSESRLYCFEQ